MVIPWQSLQGLYTEIFLCLLLTSDIGLCFPPGRSEGSYGRKFMICFRGRGRGQGELYDAVVSSLLYGCCVLEWQLSCSKKTSICVAAHATHFLGTFHILC